MKKFTWFLAPVFSVVALSAGCNTTSTQEGMVGGGLLGAGAGAIIGNQSGNTGEGALIGGAAGALAGALIGDQKDRRNPPPQARYVEPTTDGHWETRTIRTPSGETYEERVWVQHR